MSTTDQEVGETTTTHEESLEKGFLGTHQDPEPDESYGFEAKAAELVDAAKSSRSAPSSGPSPKSSKASSS